MAVVRQGMFRMCYVECSCGVREYGGRWRYAAAEAHHLKYARICAAVAASSSGSFDIYFLHTARHSG